MGGQNRTPGNGRNEVFRFSAAVGNFFDDGTSRGTEMQKTASKSDKPFAVGDFLELFVHPSTADTVEKRSRTAGTVRRIAAIFYTTVLWCVYNVSKVKLFTISKSFGYGSRPN